MLESQYVFSSNIGTDGPVLTGTVGAVCQAVGGVCVEVELVIQELSVRGRGQAVGIYPFKPSLIGRDIYGIPLEISDKARNRIGFVNIVKRGVV